MNHYTPTANQQICALKHNQRLHAQVTKSCQIIISNPSEARQLSPHAIKDTQGNIHFAMPVIGHRRTTIFWESSGPTIEAVIPWKATSRSRP